MALTQEQEQTVSLLREAEGCAVIHGAPGTGKTYLSSKITSLKGEEHTIRFSTPSVAEVTTLIKDSKRPSFSLTDKPSVGWFEAASLSGIKHDLILPSEKGGNIKLSMLDQGRLVSMTINSFCESTDLEIENHHFNDNFLYGLTQEQKEVLQEKIVYHARILWAVYMQNLKARSSIPASIVAKAWMLSEPRVSFDLVVLDDAQFYPSSVLQFLINQSSQCILFADLNLASEEKRNLLEPSLVSTLHHSARFGKEISSMAQQIIERTRAFDPTVLGGALPSSLENLQPEETSVAIGICSSDWFELLCTLYERSVDYKSSFADYMEAVVRDVEQIFLQRCLPGPFALMKSKKNLIASAESMGDQHMLKLIEKIDQFGFERFYEAIRIARMNCSGVEVMPVEFCAGKEFDSVFVQGQVCDESDIYNAYLAVSRAKFDLSAWGLGLDSLNPEENSRTKAA